MKKNEFVDRTYGELKEEYSNITPIHNPEIFPDIKPLSYEEIVISNPSPIEFVLHPWLPKQGIAFVYAATGVGKTLFTLNVAYAIAAGGKFLKFGAELPRKVLYIDGEMPYVQIYSRFMDIVKQQGELICKENWNLITPEKVKFKLPRICDPVGQQYYHNILKTIGAEVLILDNLSALSAIDENNSEQWKIIQDWLVFLRTEGYSIIIVHHAGKDKTGYRGTSRMLDCADTAISLQEINEEIEEKNVKISKKFLVKYHKNRSFNGEDALSFEVELNPSGWSFESASKNNTIRIIEMFSELGMKAMEISKELNISHSYVRRIIRRHCR